MVKEYILILIQISVLMEIDMIVMEMSMAFGTVMANSRSRESGILIMILL